MELITSNWAYVAIALLCVDKAVALSPSKMDDLIWHVLRKAFKKAAGK